MVLCDLDKHYSYMAWSCYLYNIKYKDLQWLWNLAHIGDQTSKESISSNKLTQTIQPMQHVYFQGWGLVSKYRVKPDVNLDNGNCLRDHNITSLPPIFGSELVYWQTLRENQIQTCSTTVAGSTMVTFITPIFITVTFTKSIDISLS